MAEETISLIAFDRFSKPEKQIRTFLPFAWPVASRDTQMFSFLTILELCSMLVEALSYKLEGRGFDSR
jgi:NADH:ubiquinone oxidoreductase subunit 3 (subunit A)